MTRTAFSPPQAAGGLSRAVTPMRALALAAHPIAVSACLRENSLVGHIHLANFNTVWTFRGKSFPRVKAVTHPGQGALRLSRSCLFEPRSPGDAVNCPTGAGQALRRST
jgi:hypothetical protein